MDTEDVSLDFHADSEPILTIHMKLQKLSKLHYVISS